MYQHLSARNISSKSIHAFLSSLPNRQTDKRGRKHLPPPLLEVTRRLTLPLAVFWIERLYVYILIKCTEGSRPSLDRFSAFGREIIWRKSCSFLFSISKSVLPPCYILWSLIRSESDLLTSLPFPKEFRHQQLNFATADYLLSSW